MRTLKLMAEYQCYPLWEASPDEIGNIDPDFLPISESLRNQLLEWADSYDGTLNWEDPFTSGFPNVDAVEEFKTQGIKLADQLRAELGPEYTVLVKINASVKTSRT